MIVPRTNRRPGVTLIELVISIGVMAVILAATVSLVAVLFSGQRKAQFHVERSVITEQLSSSLRQDAWKSVRITVVDEGQGIRCELGSGQGFVEYRFSNEQLVRIHTVDDVNHKELFRLQFDNALSFKITESETRRFLVFSTERRIAGKTIPLDQLFSIGRMESDAP